MKLLGAMKKTTKSKNGDVVKEACMEDERCKGLFTI